MLLEGKISDSEVESRSQRWRPRKARRCERAKFGAWWPIGGLQRPPTSKTACVMSRSIATRQSDGDSSGWRSVRAEGGLAEPRALRSPTGENRSASADCETTRSPMPKFACATSILIATRRFYCDSKGWGSVRAEDGAVESRTPGRREGNFHPAARWRWCTTTRQDIWVPQSNSPYQDMRPGLVH